LAGGPAVAAVNRHLLARLAELPDAFDLIWVDKAVFLREGTVERLRERTKTMVHYTPDTAFFGNRSRHYLRSGRLYDLHITTKSFELAAYRKQFPENSVLLTSQGYQEGVHRSLVPFEEKDDAVAFVGLAEPSRFEIIDALLNAGVPVKLAGKGWRTFVRDRGAHRSLRFVGEILSGDDYVRFISSSRFALGLLSKRFPELHTTRTFEIPACGTALLTERNEETSGFFTNEEAIFYEGTSDLVRKIIALREERDTLQAISEAGRKRVIADGRSYDRLLGDILRTLELT
jgi:spore maturation protein CgeB